MMDLCKRRKNCRRIVTLPGCCQILLINFSLILSILFFIAQHEFFHQKILTSRSPWRCCRRISSTEIRLIGRSSSRSPPFLVDVAVHRRRKEELRVASSHVITGSEPGPPYSLQNAQTDNDLECTSVLAGEMVDNIANTDHYLGPGSLGEDFQYGDGKGWGTALETEDVVSKIASAYKIDPSEVRARLKAINQTVSNMIKRAESAAPRVTRDLKYIADWLKGEVAGLPQAVDASTIRTMLEDRVKVSLPSTPPPGPPPRPPPPSEYPSSPVIVTTGDDESPNDVEKPREILHGTTTTSPSTDTDRLSSARNSRSDDDTRSSTTTEIPTTREGTKGVAPPPPSPPPPPTFESSYSSALNSMAKTAKEFVLSPEKLREGYLREGGGKGEMEEEEDAFDYDKVVKNLKPPLPLHCIKTRSSCLQKVLTEALLGQMPEFTPECVERRFKDVLRFTLIYNDSPPGLHVTNIKATLNDLEDQGYIVEQVKNYWPRHGDNYCGVNCVLRTPHGIRWELQFHTPLSARTNAGTHSIFEEYRSATVNVQRKRELFDRISLPWKHVPVPYRMLDRRHKLHPSMRTIRLNRP